MDTNNNNNNTTTTTISSNDSSSTTSAATTTNTNNNSNRDQFLRHLNKLSYKISKPTPSSSSKPPLEPPPPPPPLHPPQQQQPPVYNINKSQFRDVVQKLTGSPAHAAVPPPQSAQPPPIHAPKPASSRLQRIRPPPLVQLSTRPPAMLNSGVNPLSPLPPLPTCHAAAESPISAYMRFLHSSGTILQPPPQAPPSDTTATAMVPPFGYFPSPKSPCPLLSPNLGVFSPTGSGPLGFPQLPVSPTVPGVPSPKWRDL